MRGPNPQQRFTNLGVITVPYGGKTKEEAVHPAIDVANNIGTPIPATVDGVVTKVDGGHVQGENNFGNSVTIKDADGNSHEFHHLANIGAKQGQRVNRGQQVATMGNTGATYSQSGNGDGTHLDYRIVDAYGRSKDPTPYLS